MKKLFLILIMLLILFGCVNKKASEEEVVIDDNDTSEVVEKTEDVETIEDAELVVPFVVVESLEELNKEMGFEFIVPETIDVGKADEFFAYKELGMAEVDYIDGEEYYAYARKIRKDKIEEDMESISGLYAEFDEKITNEIYTLSKINDVVYISEWELDDFRYALILFNGATEEVAVELSKMIK